MALSCSKKLSAVLRGILSKDDGDSYCLNCLRFFTARNKLESHKKYFKIKKMKTLRHWSLTPIIIYADLESLIKVIDGCKYNFGKSFTAKVDEHIPCRYSVSTI